MILSRVFYSQKSLVNLGTFFLACQVDKNFRSPSFYGANRANKSFLHSLNWPGESNFEGVKNVFRKERKRACFSRFISKLTYHLLL